LVADVIFCNWFTISGQKRTRLFYHYISAIEGLLRTCEAGAGAFFLTFGVVLEDERTPDAPSYSGFLKHP
jgi:hypothetical protein